MNAIALYRLAHDAGLRIRADGDRIRISPADRLTPQLREQLAANKPALLKFLADARKTTDQLLEVAMRVCDQHGDSQAAREEMRADCLALPPHLQVDLLDHFRKATHFPCQSRNTENLK